MINIEKLTDIERKNLLLLALILPAIESQDEALAFILELCTPNEARMLPQRVGIAELLVQKIPHKKIVERLGNPSSATVSRVSETVQKGDSILRKVIMRASGVEGS